MYDFKKICSNACNLMSYLLQLHHTYIYRWCVLNGLFLYKKPKTNAVIAKTALSTPISSHFVQNANYLFPFFVHFAQSFIPLLRFLLKKPTAFDYLIWKNQTAKKLRSHWQGHLKRPTHQRTCNDTDGAKVAKQHNHKPLKTPTSLTTPLAKPKRLHPFLRVQGCFGVFCDWF